MSFLPNISWGRGSQQPQNQSGTQPSNPGTPGGSPTATQQQQAGQPANGQMGNPATTGQPNPNPQTNPMDQFSGFFAPPTQQVGPDGKPVNPTAAPAYDGFVGQWDGNLVNQRAQQLDFTRGMNPEIIQRALGGDAQSFMEAMNFVARQAFIGSTQAAHGFADRATKAGVEKVTSGLDDRFRDYGVRMQNVGTNPIYEHPAVKPMVDALKYQIASSDPKLTPQQVAQKVDEYFNQLGSTYVNQNQFAQQAEQQKKEPDWLAQFNLASPTQGQ